VESSQVVPSRRSESVYSVTAEGAVTREAAQPHLQAIEYNPLHGGIERWFEPGSELLVVENADQATDAYARLLDDPAQAEELGRAARERALDEHTFLHRARRVLDLLGLGVPEAVRG